MNLPSNVFCDHGLRVVALHAGQTGPVTVEVAVWPEQVPACIYSNVAPVWAERTSWAYRFR